MRCLSGRNNSARSGRAQTQLSRRLHGVDIARWYILSERNAARLVGERERGSRMKKLTTTAEKSGRGIVSVERKSEWEHCAPDGSAAAASRSRDDDDAMHRPGSARSHYYIITRRDRRSYSTESIAAITVIRLTFDNPWRFMNPRPVYRREISTNPKES